MIEKGSLGSALHLGKFIYNDGSYNGIHVMHDQIFLYSIPYCYMFNFNRPGIGEWGLPFSTYASRGGGGSSLLYISIAYYMQKGGGWVQIACKIAYVLNGRPLWVNPC